MKFYTPFFMNKISCFYGIRKEIGEFVPELDRIFNIQLIFGNMTIIGDKYSTKFQYD